MERAAQTHFSNLQISPIHAPTCTNTKHVRAGAEESLHRRANYNHEVYGAGALPNNLPPPHITVAGATLTAALCRARPLGRDLRTHLLINSPGHRNVPVMLMLTSFSSYHFTHVLICARSYPTKMAHLLWGIAVSLMIMLTCFPPLRFPASFDCPDLSLPRTPCHKARETCFSPTPSNK